MCVYTCTLLFLFLPLFLLLWSSSRPLMIWTFALPCISLSVTCAGPLTLAPSLSPSLCPVSRGWAGWTTSSGSFAPGFLVSSGQPGLWLEIGNWREGEHTQLMASPHSPAAAQRQFEPFEERPQLLPRSTLHTLETLFSQLCVWLCVLLTPLPRPSRPGWGAARELPLPGALQYPCLSLIGHFSKFPFWACPLFPAETGWESPPPLLWKPSPDKYFSKTMWKQPPCPSPKDILSLHFFCDPSVTSPTLSSPDETLGMTYVPLHSSHRLLGLLGNLLLYFEIIIRIFFSPCLFCFQKLVCLLTIPPSRI